MNLDFKKKVIFFTLIICFSACLFSLQVIPAKAEGDIKYAQSALTSSAEQAGLFKNANLPVMLGQAINAFFGLVGVLFLIVILAGGLRWMIAGGNEDKIKQAKGMLMNGINGMIVIFLSYALVYTILLALKAAEKVK